MESESEPKSLNICIDKNIITSSFFSCTLYLQLCAQICHCGLSLRPCFLTFTWDPYPLCPCTSTFALCLLHSWGGNGAMWDMWWQQVQKAAGGTGTKLPPVHVIHATWPQWEAILTLRGKLENQTSRKDVCGSAETCFSKTNRFIEYYAVRNSGACDATPFPGVCGKIHVSFGSC